MKYLLSVVLILSGTLSFAKNEKAAKRQPSQAQLDEKHLDKYSFDITDQSLQKVYDAIRTVGLLRDSLDQDVPTYEAIIKCTPSRDKAKPHSCVITRQMKDKSDY